MATLLGITLANAGSPQESDYIHWNGLQIAMLVGVIVFSIVATIIMVTLDDSFLVGIPIIIVAIFVGVWYMDSYGMAKNYNSAVTEWVNDSYQVDLSLGDTRTLLDRGSIFLLEEGQVMKVKITRLTNNELVLTYENGKELEHRK